ncbi:GNAT family N-acetyltransferase [Phreatobacter stygius]|uniref:GNAT family N-acetyltransferase n=1 Tax=Phreatobacter stygius TaxID=1940610 RepID=A0A4D7AVW5_9HYPH|nr:GNAT family N-acetyltransferase [Phreatobacter stygius]QCI63695.1 GNAT family N-acetyltransferase [Phreatobacter stygius]
MTTPSDMASATRPDAPARPLASAARTVEAAACAISVVPAADLSSLNWPSNLSNETIGTVFQSLEFVTLWCETIGARRGARGFGVAVTLTDGAPVLYLPLAVETRLGLHVLRFMDGGVAGMNAPILAKDIDLVPGALAVLWPRIIAALPPVDAVDFTRIAGHVKDRRNPLIELGCADHGAAGNLIDIAGQSFDDYAATKARRGEIGKVESRRRQMARLGPVSFAIAGTAGEATGMLEALVGLRRRQILRSHGHDRFETGGHFAFYRGAIAEGRLSRLTNIAVERCGDTVTAAVLGFIEPGHYRFALTAYELDSYGRFSSGARLLIGLIRRSFALRHATFDLGESDQPYKDVWATRRLPLLDHAARVTWRGHLYFAAKRLRRTCAAWHQSDFAKWARASLAHKPNPR